MIGFISGKVIGSYKIGKSTTFLLVWPNEQLDSYGVAYSVLVTNAQAELYPLNASARFWLYAVHSENDAYNIGFPSSDSLEYFMKLLDVSGVGAKSAMQILGVLGIDGVMQAVTAQDVTVLGKVPGIGKKTAAKIVLELTGKLTNIESVVSQGTSGEMHEDRDIIATLQKLGYSTANAKEAVIRVASKLAENKGLDLAEKVKLVLSSGS
jgi:Holliday junction DNA helicase RuvA